MRYLLFVILLASAQLSDAQDTIRTNVQLQEVVVTGTGTEHYLKDAPVLTEVISGKALEQYAGRSLDDVLGALCASLNFSPGDMGSNIQLNGLNNDYILILINGKRMNGDNGGQNDLNIIDPANIERIEIVKGASSSLYGSDAIAGVINIITRKNKDKVGVSNTTRLGYHGDVSQSNLIGFNNGKLNSTTSFNVKHTDGWRNTNLEWKNYDLKEGSVSKTVNRTTDYSISENLTYKINKQLTLSADASFYEKWKSRLCGPYSYHTYGFYYRDQNYAAGARYKLHGRNYLAFDQSYNKYDYYYDYTHQETTDYFDQETGKRIIYYPGTRVMQTSQRQLLSQLKGVFYFGEQHIVNAGIEYQWDKLISPHRLKESRASVYTLSGYAQEEWNPLESLNFTAGLRLVHHKEFGQKVTPKLSVLYKVGDFNLRGTYSYGFKAPTVKELYYSYIGVIMGPLKAYYGNENLKPQTSNYYAASLEYHHSKLQASLTGYYNSIHNMIALTIIPTSPEDKFLEVQESRQYNNLSKARSFGADFTVNYQLLPSLSVGGSYSYVDAKAQYTDDPKDANYLKYIPINATSAHNATWKAAWTHGWKRYKLGINLFGRYQSERYYLSDGNGKAHQLWRLNTSHALPDTKHWKLNVNAGIDNIFNYIDDTPFGRNRGTTNPGRTLYISFTAKFQNKIQ